MRNKKKGFTIVELVIVIAVIGILSAILIPTFAGLTGKANEAKLQEEVRNVYVAYAAENDAEYASNEVIITKTAVTITAPATTGTVAAKGGYMIDNAGKWVLNEETKTVEQLNGGEAINGYYIYLVVTA
jgi:type IV pilus assembly protein PilA